MGNAGIVLRDEAGAELGLKLRQLRLQIADRLAGKKMFWMPLMIMRRTPAARS
jgi:hypothetical protein